MKNYKNFANIWNFFEKLEIILKNFKNKYRKLKNFMEKLENILKKLFSLDK